MEFVEGFVKRYGPDHIPVESYKVAEDQAMEVMECFHPTEDSEALRRRIIQYLQKLIRGRLSCQVFPYGSVQLRTYLPDGDIDLTVVSATSDEKEMAEKVRAVLEEEEKNEAAMFRVANINFLPARVKLVECTVQDIAVDISFNQLDGLSALCFLEEIDSYVGRDHLFKLSLLLIKSWCFYESHVLGGYRGFLSTYALDIMVLYIFQLFSQSIRGPLMALYIFLDYFGKFDWDTYGINLKGPVRIPKLGMPTLHKFIPGNCGGNLFFCDKFLSWCMDTYSVPLKDLESDLRIFQMNIVDPIQPYNNLGRSVNPGNSRTICGALRDGAQDLGRILLLPREKIAGEVRNFLTRGMQRHGPVNISTINAPLLDLAGDHAGNIKNLVDAHLIHGYNSVLQIRPSLGVTALVPVPPAQATFDHPSLCRCGSCLGDSQRPPQGMASYVSQKNASSSNGNSSQWRGKENVTENFRQGKSVTRRN